MWALWIALALTFAGGLCFGWQLGRADLIAEIRETRKQAHR